MTREEEIYNAILKLEIGAYDDLLGNDEYSGNDLQNAFYLGAKWADKNPENSRFSKGFNDNDCRIENKDKMNFSEALKLLKQGETLKRDSWSGNKKIMLVDDGSILPFIGIITKDGSMGVYTATNCDILANDWVCLLDM